MNKFKGIIFDLDQTLVDSSIAQHARDQRNWQRVYSLIPSFRLYDGWKVVFEEIQKFGIKCCVVTNSPSVYASKVIKYFNIPSDFVIGYHDVRRRKPNPDPIILAISKLQLNPEVVVSIGDRADDIYASNMAKTKSVACLWGAEEKDDLINSTPTFIIKSPTELLNIL